MVHPIAFVTANPELYETIQETLLKHALPASLVLGEMDSEVDTVYSIIAKGAKAIIGRGQLVSTFPISSGVPIVKIEISPLDVVRAIADIKNVRGPIGVIGFKHALAGCEEIGKVMGVDLHHREVTSLDEGITTLQAFAEAGISHVVGTFGLVQKARLFGLTGITIRSGEEAILRAFRDASYFLALQSSWRVNTEMLCSVVSVLQEGIIAIDKDELVSMINPVAESLLLVEAEDAIGKHIDSIFPQFGLRGVLYTDVPSPSVQLEIRGRTLLCNTTPVMYENKNIGAIACFQDVSSIRRRDTLIYANLKNKGLLAHARLDDLLGTSPPMRDVLKLARRYAQADSGVLIMGETGTGKELMAQGLHNASPRAGGPFVAVNCAALPEPLLESELFGYEEGAFTGAKRGGKVGFFELADGGTLFLDEVGEMPCTIQARLLRVLQERMLLRLGGQKMIPVNVRILAATNKNLARHVAAGTFRSDLYYRLNALPIVMPALRERPEDIPLLVDAMLHKLSAEYGRKLTLDFACVQMLQSFPWPGNVRELNHFLERLCILGDERLSVAKLEKHLRFLEYATTWGTPPAAEEVFAESPPATQPLYANTLHHIYAVLQAENGNLSRTAARLGIARSTLWRKLRNARPAGEVR